MCIIWNSLEYKTKRTIIINTLIIILEVFHLTLGLLAIGTDTTYFASAPQRPILISFVFLGQIICISLLIFSIMKSFLNDETSHDSIDIYALGASTFSIFIGLIFSAIDIGFYFDSMPMVFKIYELTFIVGAGIMVLVLIGFGFYKIIRGCCLYVEAMKSKMEKLEQKERNSYEI